MAASALALLGAVAASSLNADDDAISISSRLIENFKVGSSQTRFGDFEFVGGLELSSSSSFLGAMSAMRLAEDRNRFLGVMDTGFWYAGRLERDDSGRMIGVEDFTVSPILDSLGNGSDEKWMFDAEGVVLRGDEVLVSFERHHRVDIYPADRPGGATPLGSLPVLIPEYEFRGNRGLEMIAVAPTASQLSGAVVAISEKSLNESGDIFAAILTGPSKGVFFVKRDPPFDITDGDFLPNGDLLLLERRFSIAEGIGMRIRASTPAGLEPGNLVDGPSFWKRITATRSTIWKASTSATDEDGKVFITLVSDDNHSILQRNLVLEFRYVGDNSSRSSLDGIHCHHLTLAFCALSARLTARAFTGRIQVSTDYNDDWLCARLIVGSPDLSGTARAPSTGISSAIGQQHRTARRAA
jgi:hypothetical protein